jgi:hypothetical protein
MVYLTKGSHGARIVIRLIPLAPFPLPTPGMLLSADANPCSQLLTTGLIEIRYVVVLVVEGQLRDWYGMRTARLVADTQFSRIDAMGPTVTFALIEDRSNKRATLFGQDLLPPISVGALPEQGRMLLNGHLNKGTLDLGRQRRRATHLTGVLTNQAGTPFNFKHIVLVHGHVHVFVY